MSKRPLSTQIEERLLKEMRAAVVQLAGPPEYLTISEIVARGVERVLDYLATKHNGGHAFRAPRGRTPKTGPRAKA